MIDHGKEPGRIDLRAIAEDPQFANVNRIMTDILGRSAGSLGAPRQDVFAVLVAHSRPLATAAAILLTTSMVALALPSGRRPSVAPEVKLAEWAQSNHVPTNAELLIAFEGYGR